MRRLAIFVDAGYLYAQGSVCVFGERRERRHLRIDPDAVTIALKDIGRQLVPEAYLLRIYWYDGLRSGLPTPEQSAIAALPDVKMRFGYVNSAGQQKGVDTRIVTDLVELARNQAITDAIVVSGDEDLRVGVEIAQSFGIRVHLLGIQPAAGSQARALRDEADSVTEWQRQQVTAWLQGSAGISSEAAPARMLAPVSAESQSLASHVTNFVAAIENETYRKLLDQSRAGNLIVPPEIDRPLLASARRHLERQLSDEERAQMRRLFWEAITARSAEEG